MGREIRKVPAGWIHPKETDPNDKRGMGYHPMHSENYETVMDEWIKNHRLWLDGEHPDQLEGRVKKGEYKYWAEWADNPPPVNDYVHYKPEECTHFQAYENVTEGTPVTPVFASLQELEDWLVEKGELYGTRYCRRYDREDAANFCKWPTK